MVAGPSCRPGRPSHLWSESKRTLSREVSGNPHLTEEPDGRFNAQFTQTGTYHVDFVDAARTDQDSQYTDSIHHVFTPGKVEVFNETFHDFPDGIKIWVRIHATVLEGRFIVERVVDRVAGCPS